MGLHQLREEQRNRFAECERARVIVGVELAPYCECGPLDIA
jgi:hypothetical protein